MEESKQWLTYAIDDLAYGELGLESLPRAASWSLQQASEKALKALLLSKAGEIPRTHDVAYLLSQLQGSAQVPDELADAVLLIAEITPTTRYPSDDLFLINKEDAREYFDAAKRIVDWVTQEMTPEKTIPHRK